VVHFRKELIALVTNLPFVLLTIIGGWQAGEKGFF
jgi:hypothetical protein